MNYARAIRICRAALGVSQATLAKRSNLSPSHVSLLESNERQPSGRTLAKLTKGTGIPLHLIMLLAAEPGDLESEPPENLSVLARRLLELLLEAEGETQELLPLGSG